DEPAIHHDVVGAHWHVRSNFRDFRVLLLESRSSGLTCRLGIGGNSGHGGLLICIPAERLITSISIGEALKQGLYDLPKSYFAHFNKSHKQILEDSIASTVA